MEVKELQQMSDNEVNALSAFNVMPYKFWNETADGNHPFQGEHDWLDNKVNYPHFIKYQNGRVILWKIPNADGVDWKPCSDMNDAIKLLNELNEIEMLDYAAYCADLTGHPETTNYNLGCLVGILKLNPKQRTIAAILAKDNDAITSI